jgi:hypothetical protein
MLKVVDIFLNIKKIEKFQLFSIYLSPKNVERVQKYKKCFLKMVDFFPPKLTGNP